MKNADDARAVVNGYHVGGIFIGSWTDLSMFKGPLADIAHSAGAVLAIDSTAATPVLTRPLSLGADLVMHSATKYLNGHSDVVAGTLTTAREDAFWSRLRTARSSGGAILGSFEAYLLLRGMRTLFPRVERACRSARQIAEAKLVCNRCPVTTECLTWALDSGQDAGVWGGMSEDERRALKRRNARTRPRSSV